MDSLDEMAVFAGVAEAGGFTAAAAVLGISKSAVSKRVSRLEDRLGARLLNRTTRRLSLTEVGAAFHERCIRILAEVEEAELAVSNLQAKPRGTLRVNAPMSFGVLHVVPALAGFMSRYPELKVDLVLNDRVVDLIEEGFDVAVRIANLPDSSLVARRLASFRRVVCASPDYLRRHGTPVHPRDLRDHNCLNYTYLLTTGGWRFRGPSGPLTVSVSGTLEANNGDALCAAALSGIGVCMLPIFIVDKDLLAGRLQAVLRDFEETGLSIQAVFPHARHLSAKVRAFIDFLAQRFAHSPYWDAGQ